MKPQPELRLTQYFPLCLFAPCLHLIQPLGGISCCYFSPQSGLRVTPLLAVSLMVEFEHWEHFSAHECGRRGIVMTCRM